MIFFFTKFYLVCSLMYITVVNTDEIRNQRAMMRGRPNEILVK